MARRRVNREKTQIDPIFYKPEDVRDIEYLGEDFVDFGEIGESDSGIGEVIDSRDPNALPVADSITIISQTAHKDFTGNDVVDVVIEVADYDNVKAWNIRNAFVKEMP